MRHFKEKWNIVAPAEHVLGAHFDVGRGNKTDTFRHVPVNDEFMYLPIWGFLSSRFSTSFSNRSKTRMEFTEI